MYKKYKNLLWASFLLLLAPLILIYSIESYWPLNPLIDTKFSQNFTISKFDQIKEGDSIQEVLETLGEPIWKLGCGGCWEEGYYVVDGILKIPPNRRCESACDSEYQYWQFSDDGACTWWDFAWQYFAINFHNGKVNKKRTDWHFD